MLDTSDVTRPFLLAACAEAAPASGGWDLAFLQKNRAQGGGGSRAVGSWLAGSLGSLASLTYGWAPHEENHPPVRSSMLPAAQLATDAAAKDAEAGKPSAPATGAPKLTFGAPAASSAAAAGNTAVPVFSFGAAASSSAAATFSFGAGASSAAAVTFSFGAAFSSAASEPAAAAPAASSGAGWGEAFLKVRQHEAPHFFQLRRTNKSIACALAAGKRLAPSQRYALIACAAVRSRIASFGARFVDCLQGFIAPSTPRSRTKRQQQRPPTRLPRRLSVLARARARLRQQQQLPHLAGATPSSRWVLL